MYIDKQRHRQIHRDTDYRHTDRLIEIEKNITTNRQTDIQYYR